jgi:hypothetical protein
MNTHIIELFAHSIRAVVHKFNIPGCCSSKTGRELGMSKCRSNTSWTVLEAHLGYSKTSDVSRIACTWAGLTILTYGDSLTFQSYNTAKRYLLTFSLRVISTTNFSALANASTHALPPLDDGGGTT